MAPPENLKSEISDSKSLAPIPRSSLNQEVKQKPQREREEKEFGRERYDQPNEALEFYRLKRLPEGESRFPLERYLTARTQIGRMPRYSTAQGRAFPFRSGTGQEVNNAAPTEPELRSEAAQAALNTWTPLGPGNIGGRTRALVIHPTNPSIMYAAGVAGGVWKTTNGGASWTPISDLIANIAVSALAMDPTNPNVIYAGTGEGYFNIDAARGAGIFKSFDGGNSWTQLIGTNTSDFYFVNDIVVSPVSSQRLYAATRTGVWQSTDGGASWTKSLSVTATSGCLDLAIRTDQPTDFIFAACGNLEQATVYRNVDAAGSGVWTPVLSESGMGRTSLAIAPSNQNVVYALSAELASGDYEDGLHALFRSTSGGEAGTWTPQVRNSDPTKLNTMLLTNTLFAFLNECGYGKSQFYGQGWYDNVIAVDPVDANRVWVGGIDLFRSEDGGRNWGLASYSYFDNDIPQYTHPDHHVIVFHPWYNGASNKTLFVGNDGGLYRTDDALAPVGVGARGVCDPNQGGVRWTSLNNNYAVTQFYHGVPYPDGTSYVGGTQDNGTLRGTDAGGINGWREVYGGDGGFVAVDPNDPSVVYAENTGLSIKKSFDGGANFRSMSQGITEPQKNFLFITPFLMDPTNAQRLWTGGQYIWRTVDGANEWAAAGVPIAGNAKNKVSSLAVAPSDANFMLVGTSQGYIHRTNTALTADANTVWPAEIPRNGYVSWVAFDPHNPSLAYATYSTFGGAHVWRSLDAGATWTGIDGSGATGLPDIPVHSIIVDPSNTSRLYIGTDLGVFVSTDGGARWAVENTGFANVVVESLALNTVGGVTSLYAFTHGRGAWRVAVNNSGGGSTPCSFSLASTGQSFEAAGGAGSVSVTANASDCRWTAVSNASWITVAAGGSGSGSGSVTFTVAANSGAARSGSLTIAGQTFTVTQAGVGVSSCTYSISTTSQSFSASGGSGQVGVSAPGGCNWTANSNASWIAITSGSSGSSNGTVGYAVAANTSASARTGTLLIAGQSFTVTQSGVARDATPPIVTITDPTRDSTFMTSDPNLSISGTATDNVGVTLVTWINDQGGGGIAVGTNAWTIRDLSLKSGANVITVTATDAAGNTSSAILVIIYSPQ